MTINPTKLDQELRAAGVPIHGCDSTGVVFFMDAATSEQRATAAQIVAAHDPSPSDADLRAKEYPSTVALVVALWERVVEGRPEASDALQTQREAVKDKYPKPGVGE